MDKSFGFKHLTITTGAFPALILFFFVLSLCFLRPTACALLSPSARKLSEAKTDAVSTSNDLAVTQGSLPNESSNLRVNINTATQSELERLPGIGPALAARIIEYRQRYGPFRRPEEIILVRGFSERRFYQLKPYITVE